MSKVIHVVAGVITDNCGRFLIAKRPNHVHQGGLWEFPGGKVDAGESARAALIRELEEELAIGALKAEPFLEVSHEYSDKSVLLDIWLVSEFSGQAMGNEGQEIRWVAGESLADYEFPEANLPIIAKIQERYCSK